MAGYLDGRLRGMGDREEGGVWSWLGWVFCQGFWVYFCLEFYFCCTFRNLYGERLILYSKPCSYDLWCNNGPWERERWY